MKKALIIGISGQDGAYLADFLLRKNYRVFGTSRDPKNNAFSNLRKLGILDDVNLTSMTLNDNQAMEKVLGETIPDEIYLLAAQSSVELSFERPVETFESNTVAVLNILECLRKSPNPPRLFFAASGYSFGNLDSAADETTPFRPCSPYGTAKAAAFWLVANYRKAYHLPICSGILFNHESPLRPDRFVTRSVVDTAVQIANGNEEMLKLGNLDIYRDWGWAPEYVDAMWRMLQQDPLRDLVISTGVARSLTDYVETVFRTLGLDWCRHVKVEINCPRPNDILYSCGNPFLAEEVLGWKAVTSFEQVVDRLVKAAQAEASGTLTRAELL